jgi:hypothetical protein
MIFAVTFMILWSMMGIVAIAYDRLDRINYPMVMFISFTPFFPFIFHWCGLF